jgi:hypothetical protein
MLTERYGRNVCTVNVLLLSMFLYPDCSMLYKGLNVQFLQLCLFLWHYCAWPFVTKWNFTPSGALKLNLNWYSSFRYATSITSYLTQHPERADRAFPALLRLTGLSLDWNCAWNREGQDNEQPIKSAQEAAFLPCSWAVSGWNLGRDT